MSVLPYPPPPELGWYDEDATVMPQQTAEPQLAANAQPVASAGTTAAVNPPTTAEIAQTTAQPTTASQDDDDIDWEGTVLSTAFTASAPKQEYELYNEQTGQRIIVDTGVLLGRKPSQDLPQGVKAVKLDDPTRTISRNHAAISFDIPKRKWSMSA